MAAYAVRHVTLNIRAGQNVAIVGANGSGKTTLLSMVPRLLNPTAGRILIDGHDITQYSLRSLRRQIGLVTQDSVLFHATIGENISYGLRRPKTEDVLAAAQRFVEQAAARAQGDTDTMDVDNDFLLCMEYGMPPISGWGMGVDRIVALLTNAANLREVVLFPLLRPE